MRSKEKLKKIACEAIDKRKDEIIAFAKDVASEPEYGYKEVKTSKKFSDLLSKLGYESKTGIALTGVVAEKAGNKDDFKIAIMGELDAIGVPAHKDADPQTGAVHACGHNAQLASVAAVAYALSDTDIMKDLDGSIKLMGVPAEECIEITYRKKLIDEGKISFLGGKQEFIKLGQFDDVDMTIMQHSAVMGQGYTAGATSSNTGFTIQLINYKGKPAHAGAAPFDGVNALNAAMLGIMGIHAQRETFKDEDHIRVHPIITKGGDIVNVVPADVRLENYVRGANPNAIMEAAAKVERAFTAGAMANGSECEIIRIPGYLPAQQCCKLNEIMYNNMVSVCGKENTLMDCPGFGGGSSDQGDVSQIIPSIQSYFAGVTGGLHSEHFCMADYDATVIKAAKCMIMTAIDALYDGAKLGSEIKSEFKPNMTKDQYLKDWGHLA